MTLTWAQSGQFNGVNWHQENWFKFKIKNSRSGRAVAGPSESGRTVILPVASARAQAWSRSHGTGPSKILGRNCVKKQLWGYYSWDYVLLTAAGMGVYNICIVCLESGYVWSCKRFNCLPTCPMESLFSPAPVEAQNQPN